MSKEALTQCRPVKLPAGQKQVLMALADFHGPTGVWPSLAALVEHTCQDRRTVQRHLRELERHGYLRQTGKIHNGPRTYALMAEPKAAAIAPPQRNSQGRQYAAPWTPKGRHHAAPGAAIRTERGGTMPPNLDRSLLITREPLTNGPKEPGKSLAEIMAEAGLPPIPGVTGAPKERQPGAPGRRPDRAAEGRDLETGAFAPNPTP